ncbi:DUF418 domain-containing protein [Spiractinospora alimapuensis]|uniref:DUF418 domain-containing protein n=1 Tax=Spiractinospora alimapuensis TaxID=2820884 RepID=UPI001F15CCCF|nr:DUF418 domain-containing protein [Spiractinospora alimapuensis]QVQ51253.1 DUF418 domain-containing protein [Spiractinospora alimapuensis]
MLLGVWAARRRLLEEPSRHRNLLRRTAVVGIFLGVVGGLPMGLISAELWSAGFAVMALASVVHVLTGFAGALGAGATFALVAARLGDGHGPITRALTATGRRSLSCYLAQSVILVVLFAPYGGGLGSEIGSAGMAAAAVAVWGATVALARLADAVDRAGPAEVLLRRLSRPR